MMLPRATVVLLMAAGAAEAQQVCHTTSSRTASASGSATLRIPPDRIRFTLGVETVASTVAEAVAGNNTKLAAVLAAIKAKGVDAREIQTSMIEIDSSRDEDGNRQSGFEVSKRVTVTGSDPTHAASVLQAAVDAGANQASDFRLFVAASTNNRDRGLELAFEDARRKATKLAALSGGTLGSVLCVAEGGYSTTGFGGASETIQVSADSPAVEAGLEEITYSVYVVFDLR